MSIGAIPETSGVGPIQTDRNSMPAADPTPAAPSAPEIKTGTYPPLTPSVLAVLIGQQLNLYGSFS